MDIETAKRLFVRFDNSAYLDEQDQRLYDDACDVLEEEGLLDDDGNLIDEDE